MVVAFGGLAAPMSRRLKHRCLICGLAQERRPRAAKAGLALRCVCAARRPVVGNVPRIRRGIQGRVATHVVVLLAVVGKVRHFQYVLAGTWHSLAGIVWACRSVSILLNPVLHLFCSVVQGSRLASGLFSKSFVMGTTTNQDAIDGCLMCPWASGTVHHGIRSVF